MEFEFQFKFCLLSYVFGLGLCLDYGVYFIIFYKDVIWGVLLIQEFQEWVKIEELVEKDSKSSQRGKRRFGVLCFGILRG